MDKQVPVPGIISLGEVIRDRVIECREEALKQFRAAIRPIYGSTQAGTPDHIGSCILIEFDDRRCLLTAAHVIDNNANTSLYVGGDTLILIELEFTTSKSRSKGRIDDHYDFAIAELPAAFVESLGSVVFLTLDQIISSNGPTKGHSFLCVGYPNSQNKLVCSMSNSLAPRLVPYAANAVDRPDLLKKLEISGEHHILIDLQKHSRDDQDTKVSSYAMRGCSGGAVIDLGKMSDPEVAFRLTTPKPRLAGLFIEHHQEHQAIVATRLDAILAILRADSRLL